MLFVILQKECSRRMRVGVVVCRDALWVVCEVIRVFQVLSSSILSFIAVLFPKSMEMAQTTSSELIFPTDGEK